MNVSLETIDRFHGFFLAVSRATEEDAKAVWPRPNPPDHDYELNQPYPYHLLHNKFRLWRDGKRPFSPFCRHDIMNLLMHADDGHKSLFYDHFQVSISTYEPYRPSEGTDLFRVHSFLHYLTNMCTWNQERRRAISQSAIGQLLKVPGGPECVDNDYFQNEPWMQIVLDYDAPSSISFLYESSAPDQRANEVARYNKSLHPKEPDGTLCVRPVLSKAEKRKQAEQRARYRALESLFYADQ